MSSVRTSPNGRSGSAAGPFALRCVSSGVSPNTKEWLGSTPFVGGDDVAVPFVMGVLANERVPLAVIDRVRAVVVVVVRAPDTGATEGLGDGGGGAIRTVPLGTTDVGVGPSSAVRPIGCGMMVTTKSDPEGTAEVHVLTSSKERRELAV